MKTTFFLLVSLVASFAIAQTNPNSPDSPQHSSSTTTSAQSDNSRRDIVVNYFDSNVPKYFQYGTCISFREPNHMIKNIQVATSAICYAYKDQKCEVSQPLQLGAPNVPIIKAVNVANLGSALWAAFLCLDISDSPTGQHLEDPSMFGPIQHAGMALTPPSPQNPN